jgi:hypothetical protein
MTLCSGRCTDIQTDAANCGGCGVACGGRCTAGQCAGAAPHWTIFVYANADNNLSVSLYRDILEILRATLDSNVRVVVYADWNSGERHPVIAPYIGTWNTIMPTALALQQGGSWPTGSQLIEISGRGNVQLIRSDPERDFDDLSVLSNAVSTVFARYPTDRRGVIFWDHGASWDGGFGGDEQNGTRSNPTGIGVSTLAAALRIGLSNAGITSPRPLELVAFDTCLMGVAEVVAPFNSLATVFIGEAEVDFNAGWDYTGALSWLSANPSASAQEFAREEVRLWRAHHTTMPHGTQSDLLFRSKIALDLTRWGAFQGAMRSFSTAITSGGAMSPEAIAREAYRAVPVYGNDSGGEAATRSPRGYRDLSQFLRSVAASPSASAPLRSAASTANTALGSMTIALDQGSYRESPSIQGGLQVALPLPIVYADPSFPMFYRVAAADWMVATRWDDVLGAMMVQGNQPVISQTLFNGDNPTPSRRPRVQFSASGAVVEMELRLANQDSGGRLITYGPIAQRLVDGGTAYTIEWDGLVRAIPTAAGGRQPITANWYLRTYNPTTGAVSGLMAALGECRGPSGASICSLVFRADTGSVDVVVTWSLETRPKSVSYVNYVTDRPGSTFTPLLFAESSQGIRLQAFQGSPVTLPSSGMTVSLAAAGAGRYELSTIVTDVYGRSSRSRGYVAASAQFAF